MLMTALGIAVCMCCCAALYARPRTIRGSGRVIEASREVRDFNRVDMATIGTLRIKRGNQEGLRLRVEDNLLRYFEPRVVDGTLVIGIHTVDRWQPTEPVECDLWVKALQGITLSGAASVQAPDLQASQFSVALTGAGNVQLCDLHARKLVVWMAGAGHVMVSGSVDEQDITMQGKGEYSAGNLASTRAAIVLNGTGVAELQVRHTLRADIVGIGVIRYRGHPTTVQQSVTGMGAVMPVDA